MDASDQAEAATFENRVPSPCALVAIDRRDAETPVAELVQGAERQPSQRRRERVILDEDESRAGAAQFGDAGGRVRTMVQDVDGVGEIEGGVGAWQPDAVVNRDRMKRLWAPRDVDGRDGLGAAKLEQTARDVAVAGAEVEVK